MGSITLLIRESKSEFAGTLAYAIEVQKLKQNNPILTTYVMQEQVPTYHTSKSVRAQVK